MNRYEINYRKSWLKALIDFKIGDVLVIRRPETAFADTEFFLVNPIETTDQQMLIALGGQLLFSAGFDIQNKNIVLSQEHQHFAVG